MHADERILYDGTVTDRSIDYEQSISEWNEQEAWNRYSAKCQQLKKFAEFCRRCGGFKVV